MKRLKDGAMKEKKRDEKWRQREKEGDQGIFANKTRTPERDLFSFFSCYYFFPFRVCFFFSFIYFRIIHFWWFWLCSLIFRRSLWKFVLKKDCHKLIDGHSYSIDVKPLVIFLRLFLRSLFFVLVGLTNKCDNTLYTYHSAKVYKYIFHFNDCISSNFLIRNKVNPESIEWHGIFRIMPILNKKWCLLSFHAKTFKIFRFAFVSGDIRWCHQKNWGYTRMRLCKHIRSVAHTIHRRSNLIKIIRVYLFELVFYFVCGPCLYFSLPSCFIPLICNNQNVASPQTISLAAPHQPV